MKDYESYALRKGRSPYGERGLKSDNIGNKTRVEIVALLTESVD